MNGNALAAEIHTYVGGLPTGRKVVALDGT